MTKRAIEFARIKKSSYDYAETYMNRWIAKAGLEYIEERFKTTPEGREFILPYIEKHREEIIFGLMERGEYLIPTPYGDIRVHGAFAETSVEGGETASPADGPLKAS